MPNILGPLNTAKTFMNVVKEVDFDEVRGRAETAPRLLVTTDTAERGEAFITRVLAEDAHRFVDVRTDGFDDVDTSRFDIIVVVDPAGTGILKRVRQSAGDDASGKVVFAKTSEPEMTASEVTSAQDLIVALNYDLTTALGRNFLELRLAAVKAIVDETSKANAQFALVSNAPAVVPFIGGIVAAGADLIVLTKNQVMMVFKIAAVHERNLNNQMALMRELAPVVGTGFLWRTVAREAASFLPLAAGTVPKVVIAYVGTMVMGHAADYYYRYGQKPTKEHLKAFTDRATKSVSRLQISRDDEQEATDRQEEREPEAVKVVVR